MLPHVHPLLDLFLAKKDTSEAPEDGFTYDRLLDTLSAFALRHTDVILLSVCTLGAAMAAGKLFTGSFLLVMKLGYKTHNSPRFAFASFSQY